MKTLNASEVKHVAGAWGISDMMEDFGIHTAAGAWIGFELAANAFGDNNSLAMGSGAVLGYFLVSVLDTFEFNQRFNGLNEAEYYAYGMAFPA